MLTAAMVISKRPSSDIFRVWDGILDPSPGRTKCIVSMVQAKSKGKTDQARDLTGGCQTKSPIQAAASIASPVILRVVVNVTYAGDRHRLSNTEQNRLGGVHGRQGNQV